MWLLSDSWAWSWVGSSSLGRVLLVRFCEIIPGSWPASRGADGCKLTGPMLKAQSLHSQREDFLNLPLDPQVLEHINHCEYRCMTDFLSPPEKPITDDGNFVD